MCARHPAGRVPRHSRAANAPHHAAAYRADDVELVRPLPPEDAAAGPRRQLFSRARTVQPVLVAPVVHHPQLAELARAHHLADAQHARFEAVLHVHAQQHPLPLRRLRKRCALFHVYRHRLLDEHVLAVRHREFAVLGVQHGRRRDVDEVDARVLAHLFGVRVRRCVREVLREAAEYLRVEVCRRDDLEARVECHPRDHGDRSAAQPDDADAQHGRVLSGHASSSCEAPDARSIASAFALCRAADDCDIRLLPRYALPSYDAVVRQRVHRLPSLPEEAHDIGKPYGPALHRRQ